MRSLKKIRSFQPILLGLLAVAAIACSGNGQTSPAEAISSATTAAAPGDGHFSAVLDGQSVSGAGTDQPLQQLNSAFIYPDENNKTKLLIDVCTWQNPDAGKFTHTIRMWLPNEKGTWTITPNSPLHTKYLMIVDVDTGSMSRFHSDSITVTITSLSPTRVSGTFSGFFKLSNDTPRGPAKSMTVTEGKFDVPIATSKIRPV